MALVSHPERGTGHGATSHGPPHRLNSNAASLSESVAERATSGAGGGSSVGAAAAGPHADPKSLATSRSTSFSSTSSYAPGILSSSVSSHSDLSRPSTSSSTSSFNSNRAPNTYGSQSENKTGNSYSNATTPTQATSAQSRSPAVSPQPRSSSLAAINTKMGNVVSSSNSRTGHGHSQGPTSPSSAAAALGNVAVATGNRLKRAFAARRKKTVDDITVPPRETQEHGNGRDRDVGRVGESSQTRQQQGSHTQQQVIHPSQPQPQPRAIRSVSAGHVKAAGKLTLQLASQIFSGRRPSAPTALPPPDPSAQPPAPPPKTPSASRAFPAKYQMQMKQQAPPVPAVPPLPPRPQNPGQASHKPPPLNFITTTENAAKIDAQRGSLINVSPGMSSALEFIRDGDRAKEQQIEQEKVAVEAAERESKVEQEQRVASADAEKGIEASSGPESEKAAWRKSDSTMSHHTIRPGGVGPRSSRPVSMAESLQSTHTIVPGHKRLSALLTDADFSMPEEDGTESDDESDEWQGPRSIEAVAAASGAPTRMSPPSSLNAAKRRSVSLNVASPSSAPFFSGPQTHGYSQPVSNSITKSQGGQSSKEDAASTSSTSTSAAGGSSSISSTSATTSSASIASSSAISIPPRSSSLSPSGSSANSAADQASRAPAVNDYNHPSKSIPEGAHSHPHSRPMMQSQSQPTRPSASSSSSPAFSSSATSSPSSSLSKAAASGFIAPSSSGSVALGPDQPTGANTRNRLAAWTAGTQGQQLQHPQRGQPEHNHLYPQSNQQHSRHQPPPQQRQPALSMTGGFPGAAGLAKRAVERMGRAFGSMSSGMSAQDASGYSSSSSSAPSAYGGPEVLVRVASNQSVTSTNMSGASKMYGMLSGGKVSKGGKSSKSGKLAAIGIGKPRRTPNAPSGTWSVSSSVASSSSVSQSDSESGPGSAGFGAPSGPSLGKCIRPPLSSTGGLVFKKPLATVCAETAIGVRTSRRSHEGKAKVEPGMEEVRALEGRKLPALVVRCAQHLLIWGIQEEGLFRVSGMPFHVSKLRSEFDTGADYDMTNCEPGDLDPHAVSSVFKAFLRELPEHILTQALVPYFDAAMAQESSAQSAQDDRSVSSQPNRAKGPSLPSGPRAGNVAGMRKAPSLTTLAMPSFAGLRPPSSSLIKALRSLIVQLPSENRDLLKTLTQLILATARESKATKMPLSNLLLVFCPSLNMSPPLLRVLCEARELWEDDVEEQVIDIKRESMVIDISPKKSETAEGVEARETDAAGSKRAETIYLDSESVLEGAPSKVNVADTSVSDTISVLQDDASYISTSEGNPSVSTQSRRDAPSPQLSSSVESLETPSTSSDDEHVFEHVDDHVYAKRSAMGYPVIADSTSSSPRSTSPGRPTISAPILNTANPPTVSSPLISGPIHLLGGTVEFPGAVNTPSLPVMEPLVRKRSIPALSLPSFSPVSGPNSPFATVKESGSSPSSPVDRMRNRLRKPSLHLLFGGKRSASPITSPTSTSSPSLLVAGSAPGLSPYLQGSKAASDSSVSTPLSAVTAPQSSVFTLPPVLSTPIESTPIELGFGVEVGDHRQLTTDEAIASQKKSDFTSPPTSSGKTPRPLPTLPYSGPSKENASTPIADRYRSASNASLTEPPLPVAVPRTKPTSRALFSSSNASVRSNASSNHLGLLDDEEDREDWTKSVLMAADMDGEWSIQR
ncbi:hypothetical protein HGRIS_002813 [Hohenbuehelia grisea]|uniref:Rho-GAP domain-containing protein n=1 Tax=Hohenbuehelia grisea TaxID=104357 RepID=A0ABR3JMJ0_9AGAR